MRLKKLSLIIIGVATLILSSALPASEPQFFTGSSNDLSQERLCASQQNKKGLLVFYGTPVCPFCKRMKEITLNQPKVQKFYKEHFRTLEINILNEQPLLDFSAKETTSKKFAKRNHIRVTPTLIFYDLDGEQLFKQVGIIADPQELIWLGEYVLAEGFRRESFSQYKRKKRTHQ